MKKVLGILLVAALIVTTSSISMASSSNPGVCDGTGSKSTCVCDGTGNSKTKGKKVNRGKQGKGVQSRLKDCSYKANVS